MMGVYSYRMREEGLFVGIHIIVLSALFEISFILLLI